MICLRSSRRAMLWYGLGMDASKKHKKKKSHKEHKVKVKSVGDGFVQLEKDQAIHTDADQNRRLRTLELSKKNNSWGFTLKYGHRLMAAVAEAVPANPEALHHSLLNFQTPPPLSAAMKDVNREEAKEKFDIWHPSQEVEPGHDICGLCGDGHSRLVRRGLRRGDVILAVDGESVDHLTHQELVDRLRQCQETMRLIVLFEDCHRIKMELHDRLIKLKTNLKGKLQELKHLEEKERQIMLKVPGFSRLDAVRTSACSSASSMDSSWDQYSIVYPASACCSLANLSISTASSEDQDILTDSLSMVSSVYSEDGGTNLDDNLVASISSENGVSETDSFTDSVFTPNNRSSVIFKPKFSVATGESEDIEGQSENSDYQQGPSEASSSDFPEGNGLPRIPYTTNDLDSPKLSPSLVENRLSEATDENQSKPDISNREDQLDSVTHAGETVDQSKGSTQSDTKVLMGTLGEAEVMSYPRPLRFSLLKECVNETDEVTKL